MASASAAPSVAPSAAASEAPEVESLVGDDAQQGTALFDKMINGMDDVADDPEADTECVDCSRKVQIKNCQKTGCTKGRKKFYKCNGCNALRSRMNRVLKHKGSLAEDWQALSTDAKQAFMSKSGALAGEALKEGMIATISFYRENADSRRSESAGEFLPLAVYAAKGYSEEHLKQIEAKSCKKFDESLNDYVYQLFIESTGQKTEETIKNVVKYQNRDTRRKPLSSDDEEEAKKKKAKTTEPSKKDELAQKREQEKKARKDKLLADKICKLIEPTLSAGTSLIRYKVRLPAFDKKIPDFVKDECAEFLSKLEMVDAIYKSGAMPTEEEFQLDKVTELKKRASKAFDNMQLLVKMIEGKA